MTLFRHFLLLGIALLLAACKSNAVHEEQPARIVNPGPASLAELQQVISEMLNGAEVTLAQDALTRSSILVIERQRIRSLENPPLTGRDLGMPERFRLVKSGERCLLYHQGSEASAELFETACEAE